MRAIDRGQPRKCPITRNLTTYRGDRHRWSFVLSIPRPRHSSRVNEEICVRALAGIVGVKRCWRFDAFLPMELASRNRERERDESSELEKRRRGRTKEEEARGDGGKRGRSAALGSPLFLSLSLFLPLCPAARCATGRLWTMMRHRDRVDCRPAARPVGAPGQSWYGQPQDKVDINTRWSVNEAYVLRRAHAWLSPPPLNLSLFSFASLSRAGPPRFPRYAAT